MDRDDERSLRELIATFKLSCEQKLKKDSDAGWRIAGKRLGEIERHLDETGKVEQALLDQFRSDWSTLMKRKEKRGSFVALGKDDREVMVVLSVEIYDVTNTMNPAGEEDEGRTFLETSDGQPVSRVSKGVYKIVATGEVLTSDDPNAP